MILLPPLRHVQQHTREKKRLGVGRQERLEVAGEQAPINPSAGGPGRVKTDDGMKKVDAGIPEEVDIRFELPAPCEQGKRLSAIDEQPWCTAS